MTATIERPLPVGEAGSSLLMVLLSLAFLTAVCVGTAWVAISETTLSQSFIVQQELFSAAEAAIDRTRIGACGGAFVEGGAGTTDGTLTPSLPNGGTLSLAAEEQRLQADSDGRYLAGPDRPHWRLVAHAPLVAFVPAVPLPGPSPYVAVWVADDPADGDGDPLRDSNGRFLLLAAAFGPRGARRVAEAGVRCEAASVQAAATLEYRRELR